MPEPIQCKHKRGMLSLYGSCHEATGKALLKLLHRRKRPSTRTVEMRRFSES